MYVCACARACVRACVCACVRKSDRVSECMRERKTPCKSTGACCARVPSAERTSVRLCVRERDTHKEKEGERERK